MEEDRGTADGRAKRAAIVTAASAALREGGSLSLNAVAKDAGVGVGTVYRHFATSDALVLAVYESEIRTLVDTSTELLREHPAETAFRLWVVDHLVHYFTVKNGLVAALRGSRGLDATRDSAFDLMCSAVGAILDAGVEGGSIRAGIDPGVVVRGLGGLLLDFDRDRRRDAEQLVDILWRGMLDQRSGERSGLRA